MQEILYHSEIGDFVCTIRSKHGQNQGLKSQFFGLAALLFMQIGKLVSNCMFILSVFVLDSLSLGCE